MIIIRRDKQGNLKAKYNNHNYRIYLDKNRYYFNINNVPVYCTKEVNKFMKKGGNISFNDLPTEAQEEILCKLTKEEMQEFALTNKTTNKIIIEFWNKIIFKSFSDFFELRSKILKNNELKNEIIQKLENIIGQNYSLIMRQPLTSSEEEKHIEIHDTINQAQLKIFSLQHPTLRTIETITHAFETRYN